MSNILRSRGLLPAIRTQSAPEQQQNTNGDSQASNTRKKLILPEYDDSVFEDSFPMDTQEGYGYREESDNYNQSDKYYTGNVNLDRMINKTNRAVSELSNELRNKKDEAANNQRLISDLKEKERYNRDKIEKLKKEVDYYEDREASKGRELSDMKKHMRKLETELGALKIDNEAYKSEEKVTSKTLYKLRSDVKDKDEMIDMLETRVDVWASQYDFMVTLHRDKGKMLQDEWQSVTDSMKQAGIMLDGHKTKKVKE